MPQAVPAIIIAAGQAIAGVAITKIIVAFVVNVALTYLSQALAKEPRDPGRPPVNVTINDTAEFRHGVIGTRRVGGSFVYVRTSSDDVAAPNKFLWYVIAYADHQCNALGDAYFDEFIVPAADINAGTGAVSTGWANNKLWIWSHLGTQAQTADAQLTAAFTTGADWIKWESTDRLRGVCYRVIKMERDDTAFPTGPPDGVSSIVEGALLYDMRLDSTNGGSGAHRMDNPSTWEFSNNWALGVLWLATGGSVVNDQAARLVKYGIQEDYARSDWPFWVTAANDSDDDLTGANTTPSGDQKRYTLDMEWTCASPRGEILDAAMAAGAGEMVYVHGKWRLYAGVYNTPVHSFTQDDLRGEMQVEDTTDEEERVNRVAAVYVDHDQQWKEQTTPYRFNAAYDTQDQGRELPKEIELLGVIDAYRAQRITELELRKARQMRRVVFRFGRKGMKVAPHETFYFSHTRLGWVNREWRCVSKRRERTEDGGIITVITARSEDASIYTDLVTADYATGTSVTNSIQSEAPEPPTSLAATPQPQAIEFTWSLGAFWTLNGITELWEAASGAAFNTATKLWEGRGTRKTITKNDTTTRDYWVRMRTVAGQVSDEFGVSLNGAGLAAAARKSETPDIDDNAATEVESVEDDTASLINGGGVVLQDSMVAVGLPYLLQLTATFDVWITNDGGGTPEFFIDVNGNGSLIGQSQSAFPTVATSPGQRITLQCEVPVDPSDEAGSGVVVQVGWTGAQPAGTAEMRNGALRSEKIKR